MCLCVPYLTSAQDYNREALTSLVEVEQAIFLTEDLNVKDSLLLQKTGIYKSFEKYDLALKTLDRITYTVGVPYEAQVLNERITLNYLLGNHKIAKSLLLETTFIPDYVKPEQIKLIETLNFIALMDIDNAKKTFGTMKAKVNDLDEVFEIKSLKNPDTAFKLSFMLPGSGQMYAGSFFRGLLSMGIQGGLFYVGINGISRRYFFTEALPGIALFQGFYFGGAEYARELAEQRNKEILEELSLAVLNGTKKEASF